MRIHMHHKLFVTWGIRRSKAWQAKLSEGRLLSIIPVNTKDPEDARK